LKAVEADWELLVAEREAEYEKLYARAVDAEKRVQVQADHIEKLRAELRALSGENEEMGRLYQDLGQKSCEVEEKLRAENARLREALEAVVAKGKQYRWNTSEVLTSAPPQNPAAYYCMCIAQNALDYEAPGE
jgi:predicted  nucleic acid-binding Zn-ribbon protein